VEIDSHREGQKIIHCSPGVWVRRRATEARRRKEVALSSFGAGILSLVKVDDLCLFCCCEREKIKEGEQERGEEGEGKKRRRGGREEECEM
jgi:hypothetical protein